MQLQHIHCLDRTSVFGRDIPNYTNLCEIPIVEENVGEL